MGNDDCGAALGLRLGSKSSAATLSTLTFTAFYLESER
jgi:hypothetical protein